MIVGGRADGLREPATKQIAGVTFSNIMPTGPAGEREKEILTAVVETFIATGEPVGSRTLSRANREGLSAATIRNVMADLSDAGFLEQPHTSAGRIPTRRGLSLLCRATHRSGAAVAGTRGHHPDIVKWRHRRAGVHGAHFARTFVALTQRRRDGCHQRSSQRARACLFFATRRSESIWRYW